MNELLIILLVSYQVFSLSLSPPFFFQVDEKQKTVLLSEQGYEDAEEILGVKDLYDPREQWASYVLNAVKAKELFLRDVNYIIRGKEVLIVDEFTGRVMQVIIFINKCFLYLCAVVSSSLQGRKHFSCQVISSTKQLAL